ncbi:putative Homeodomain-like protein [Seiridium unicorne]|uniref:Homeodomain-like protein n=1 Tax=Seiridium unicorne TaxID=138068 RepID=A0ABR2UDY9_9PEZI
MAADQRRGPWSQHEDGLLMKLVEEQGALNWVKISQMLNTRTPKQCRERYHQNLKPSLNHEPISPEEGEMIEQLVTQIGKRWAEIARRLHNRSDNAVKNWWNGSMNRRKRVARKRQPYDDANDPFGYSGAPSRLRLPTLSTVPYSQQYNLPSPTNSTGQYPQLPWVAGSGLPSPNTAISPTVDSVADGAPSLVSDAGSYYSESPTGYGPESPSHNSLPPLRYGESRCSPPAYLYEKTSKQHHQQQQQQQQLPCIRDALDGRSQLPTAPNSPISLSVPRIYHGTPRSPTSSESILPVDPRMRLGNILH